MDAPPILGITGRSSLATPPLRLPLYAITQTYVHAVKSAGGLSVVIPPTVEEGQASLVLSRLNGLLLSGGCDIDPAHYGTDDSPLVEKVDLERDRTEMVLTREALRIGMPILGICRGIQILNTVLGGTLFQDIPAQVPGALPHRPTEGQPVDGAAHLVHLEPHSRLASILGTTEIRVVSYHHQAAREVPQSLEIVARSPDGVIEGLEHRTHPFCIGVQWHPEILGQDLAGMTPLFAAFVESAANFGLGDR